MDNVSYDEFENLGLDEDYFINKKFYIIGLFPEGNCKRIMYGIFTDNEQYKLIMNNKLDFSIFCTREIRNPKMAIKQFKSDWKKAIINYTM